ncbi:MAG: DUF3800 domain-containing protein [Planctomycetes bacterium]|nr:DUF3800 domain-containing protein [Planctomycetota bacterium]
MATQKLYCYVDETGQDTHGRLFVVSVVVAKDQRDHILRLLEGIERTSGKGTVKWTRARPDARLTYLRAVLALPPLKGMLFYDVWPGATDYPAKTLLTIARAVFHAGGDDHKATVYMDGLPRPHYKTFRRRLSGLGVHIKKVRGRKEESDAFMRLADALCGFVRAAYEGSAPFLSLLAAAEADGTVLRN